MEQLIKRSPELAPFLTAAQQESDEDTSRLVLADFLEDRGDPRADMIRASVQLAKHHPGELEWHEAKEFLAKWKWDYLHRWFAGSPEFELTFLRGLLQLSIDAFSLANKSISFGAWDALKQGWVEHLTLRYPNNDLFNLILDEKLLTEISALELANGTINPQIVERLIEEKAELRKLYLNRVQYIREETITQLARLSQLRTLRLCDVENIELHCILPILRNTEVQELCLADIGYRLDEDYSILRECTKIKLLTLSGSRSNETLFLEYLKELPNLQHLQLVETYQWNPQDFLNISHLKHLQTLIVSPANLTQAGLQAIFGLPQLHTLHVVDHSLPFYFGELTCANTLKEFSGQRSAISANDIESLQQCTTLRRINLSRTKLQPHEFAPVSKVNTLQSIDVTECPRFTGQSLKELATLPELRQLILTSTPVKPASLRYLIDSPALREIDIRDCSQFRPKQVIDFRKAMPNCNIIWNDSLCQ